MTLVFFLFHDELFLQLLTNYFTNSIINNDTYFDVRNEDLSANTIFSSIILFICTKLNSLACLFQTFFFLKSIQNQTFYTKSFQKNK